MILRQKQGWTLDELVRRVCDYYQLPEHHLTKKARGKELALAKSLICYWGVEELGVTLTAIGKRLSISQQAVSKWINKGRAHCYSEKINLDSLVR